MNAQPHLSMLDASAPSPREAVGRESQSKAEARVWGCFTEGPPTPTLVSLASTLPARGRDQSAER
jgi:hypothetical protein